jgi:hypothetical protein
VAIRQSAVAETLVHSLVLVSVVLVQMGDAGRNKRNVARQRKRQTETQKGSRLKAE